MLCPLASLLASFAPVAFSNKSLRFVRRCRFMVAAPDSLQSRSHKLFESLSCACSFDSIPYVADLPVMPRCAFSSALYSSKCLKAPPIYSPATLTLHKGVITFACSPRTVKRYDVGTVPSKDKKKIIMALASSPDPERSYPLAVMKRSATKLNANNSGLLHTVNDITAAVTELMMGSTVANPDVDTLTVQKYVKPKGAQSWIVRIVWKHKVRASEERKMRVGAVGAKRLGLGNIFRS